jgi:ATP-dependent helicase HrpA
VANEYEQVLINALQPMTDLRRHLAALPGAEHWARADMDEQLRTLLQPGFLAATPMLRLRHYPRYMKALAVRAERVRAQPGKDEQATAQIQAATVPLREAVQARTGLLLICPAAAEYRAMLEEFRVSLFAQHLGTATPVSAKRLQRQWQAVSEWLQAHPR